MNKQPANDSYEYNAETRVFYRKTETEFSYTDGDATEKRILDIVKSVSDRSVFSNELTKEIVDWPTEYHLSSARFHLLAPFNLTEYRNVLELGSGCGAITRQLAEQCAEVTAVEGSSTRAEITSSRCSDLRNVRVYSDNFLKFKPESKFDLVTLIGVLEYSPAFSKSTDPVIEALAYAYNSLGESGSAVIAIENQFGLKYFNGHPEDHLSISYFGIEGLYTKTSPVTFGLEALKQRIQSAGFESLEIFFPFPDYKIPQVVVSEAAVKDPKFKVGEILSCLKTRSYSGAPLLSFDDTLVWTNLEHNNLLDKLANSFLIFAHKGSQPNVAASSFYAESYSLSPRERFNTKTTFVADTNEIIVTKSLLSETEATSNSKLSLNLDKAKYVNGELYISKLKRILARGGNYQDILNWLTPYLSFVKSHEVNDQHLPANFIECTPYNLVEANNELHFIDKEISYCRNIPTTSLLIRAIAYSLDKCNKKGFLGGLTYKQALINIFKETNIILGEDDFSFAISIEKDLVSFFYPSLTGNIYLENLLTSEIKNVLPLASEQISLNEQITKQSLETKRELEALINSKSWKLTAGLRNLKSLLRS